jgi:uncharacterized protein (DUF2461 family)
VEFTGFSEQAFAFFEQVQANPTWDFVQARRENWERHVHVPMEALLDALAPEFGGDGYAYHLHRDPRLWSHQVGIISVSDTIGYRTVLSLEGLLVQGGWTRSSPGQVERYRRAVDQGDSGATLDDVLSSIRASGCPIGGIQLATRPMGWPADHPRVELLRYRTLSASQWVSPAALSHSGCADAVAAAWRDCRPLISWLSEHVGPRQPAR